MPASLDKPSVPAGERIYAIGDIHGQSAMLDELLWRIGTDFADAAEERRHLVFLGDYVDRGPNAAGVLDRLIDLSRSDTPCLFLKGNHEDQMLRAIRDADPYWGTNWLSNGGTETMKSYGVDIADVLARGADIDEILPLCRSAVPDSHLDFLAGAEFSARIGDYLFVHAGIRPGVSLADQEPEDLMWIRRPFLDHDGAHPLFIIHGHSPVETPDIRANRIGIDTGAGFGRQLTALALWGTERRFIKVGTPQPPGGFL